MAASPSAILVAGREAAGRVGSQRVIELARRIELITFTVEGRQVPAVSSVDHLTAEAGRAIIAENYAAYVAEYGEPA
uniref:hypothetical protein n=1 Tax=Microtetraspora malaysiensis TaxID=161358 RepID=UPI003F49B423